MVSKPMNNCWEPENKRQWVSMCVGMHACMYVTYTRACVRVAPSLSIYRSLSIYLSCHVDP